MCTVTAVQHYHHRLTEWSPFHMLSHNASLGLIHMLSLEGLTPMTEMILCDSQHRGIKGRQSV